MGGWFRLGFIELCVREIGMLTTEHAETARRFLEDADREFDAGDVLQASEKLWGAASHAVLAEMRRRGISPSGPRLGFGATIDAVELLSQDWEDLRLRPLFTSAEMLHANFYHGFLDEARFLEQRELVREFVTRVLERGS